MKSSVLYIGTFPPRECGIATFTKDLTMAMDESNSEWRAKIIAMEKDRCFDYSEKVVLRINEEEIQDYVETAKTVNAMEDVKLVNIQHEYGIFGGKEGEFLLAFLENVEKPVLTTFHTVVDNPNPHRKKVTEKIAKLSKAIVVMIAKAKEVLQKEYGVDESKIFVIPHGIHPVSFKPSRKKKIFFDTHDKIILSTFGLLGGKSKGLEYIIDALPDIIKKYPNVIYAIIGAVHPDVLRKNKGKAFKELKAKIKKLGLEKNVRFYNRYLTVEELLVALQETDVYLTPYIQKDRKSSGTLAYALGCGAACISTPFYFAEDVIKDEENGLLVDFKDAQGFTDAVLKILDDPALKEKLEKEAYAQTRHMLWPTVVKSYFQIYRRICR